MSLDRDNFDADRLDHAREAERKIRGHSDAVDFAAAEQSRRDDGRQLTGELAPQIGGGQHFVDFRLTATAVDFQIVQDDGLFAAVRKKEE